MGPDFFDTVCIKDKVHCVADFRFIAVESKDPKLRQMSGAVGLAPDDPSNGPSFATALKTAGMISNNMFGIYMRNSAFQSNIMFGDYDKNMLAQGAATPIYYYNRLMNNNRWAIPAKNAFYGLKSIFRNSTDTYAIIDSFYSTITLPPADYEAFNKLLTSLYSKMNCTAYSNLCYYPGLCSSAKVTWPDFYIQLGESTAFSVPSSEYLSDIVGNDGNKYCVV